MIMRGGDESMCECSAVSMLDSMVWGKRREQILICKDVQIDSIWQRNVMHTSITSDPRCERGLKTVYLSGIVFHSHWFSYDRPAGSFWGWEQFRSYLSDPLRFRHCSPLLPRLLRRRRRHLWSVLWPEWKRRHKRRAPPKCWEVAGRRIASSRPHPWERGETRMEERLKGIEDIDGDGDCLETNWWSFC